jgi:hypothetical protein
MNDLYVVVPANVTVSMLGDVLGRFWTVKGSPAQPRIELDRSSKAYLTEIDMTPSLEEEVFIDDPQVLEQIKREFGGYRLIAVRYSDPALAQEVARAIASSELARMPMLLDATGEFQAPSEFLAHTGEPPSRA